MGRRGQTLAEVLIALTLVGAASCAMASLLLSAAAGRSKSDRRERLAHEAHALQQSLKNYVTADPVDRGNAPGRPAWHLPGDAAEGWALAPGRHDVTSLLPADLRASGVDARMTYTVSRVPVNGQELSRVDISVEWAE